MATEPLELDINTSTLDLYIGAIIEQSELDTLQKRANDASLTLHAMPSGGRWYVSGFSAKQTLGKIVAGGDDNTGNYRYVIRYGDTLYRKHDDTDGYKRWLWGRMKANDPKILDPLYEIINACWCGADVYVDGPNSSAIVAAAGWLFNQYQSNQLPLFWRNKQL